MSEWKQVEQELADLLKRGQEKVRTEREQEEVDRKERERKEQAIKERRKVPFRRSVRALLPACWHNFIDWRWEEFREFQHTVIVNLPGLAPISATLEAGDWSDNEEKVADTWNPYGPKVGEGATSAVFWLQVGRYQVGWDDEKAVHIVESNFRSYSYDTEYIEYDAERAMALAYEEELRKPEVQAQCDAKNQKDYERRQEQERKTQVKTTPEGRLLDALREFIRQER